MPYKDPEKKKEYHRRYFKEHQAELREKDYQYRQRPEVKSHLQEYQRQYKATHREHLNKIEREWMKEYRRTHPQYRADAVVHHRNYREQLRKKVIAHFGGKCVRCGYDDWRALQVDHIQGGGRKAFPTKRRSALGYHRELLTAVPGIIYQVLCCNCNWIKRYENKEFSNSFLTTYNAKIALERLKEKV